MWAVVVALAVSLAISFALRPKVRSQPPAGLDAIQAPTAEIGREIPVLFGRRRISGPNIVWYGDLNTVAIRKKA